MQSSERGGVETLPGDQGATAAVSDAFRWTVGMGVRTRSPRRARGPRRPGAPGVRPVPLLPHPPISLLASSSNSSHSSHTPVQARPSACRVSENVRLSAANFGRVGAAQLSFGFQGPKLGTLDLAHNI